jgi:hypothetical protein
MSVRALVPAAHNNSVGTMLPQPALSLSHQARPYITTSVSLRDHKRYNLSEQTIRLISLSNTQPDHASYLSITYGNQCMVIALGKDVSEALFHF